MSDPAPYKPKPWFSRIPPLYWLILLCVAIFLPTFVYVILMLNRADSPGYASSHGGNSQAVPLSKGQTIANIGIAQFQLLSITEQLDTIANSIKECERDAAEYRTLRDKLSHNPKGKPLTETKWINTVFLERWQNKLPTDLKISYFHKKLDALRQAPEHGLLEKTEEFSPDQRFRDFVYLLWTEVEYAQNSYAKHLRLMAALTRQIEESPNANQDTIAGVVLKMEDDMMLGEFEKTLTGSTSHATMSDDVSREPPLGKNDSSWIDRNYERIVKPNTPADRK